MSKTEKNSKKSAVNKNKYIIDNLKNEAEKLKEQLCIDTLHQSNFMNNSELVRLQEEGDEFANKIEIEKRKLIELDLQIAEMNEIIKVQREAVGGIQGMKETHDEIAKKVKGIE